MAQFKLFKFICEVKTLVVQWLGSIHSSICICLTLAYNGRDSSLLVYFILHQQKVFLVLVVSIMCLKSS